MKRQKPRQRRKRRTGMSPWQRRGKTAFRYSDSVVRWREAIKKGNASAAREADDDFRAMIRRRDRVDLTQAMGAAA
jgi:hypothetical protein